MTNFYPPNGAIDIVIEPRPTMLDPVIKGSVPLPTVTRTDMRLMHYLASLMHSCTSRNALNMAGLLADSLFIETPAVIVRATACATPLFLGEMEAEAIATRHPVVLLRHSQAQAATDVTIDLVLPDDGDLRWLQGYQLFRGLAGDSWLVPSGDGPSVRLLPHRLFLTEHATYADDWDRRAGIERASAHLDDHLHGGWSWR
ncbi:hypothetical protein [Sphingopyxis sp. C-1]|uniref:hypothetical protein n=1 Tax=Sphingopyxis sp. C-1 TaxID=262667 RepID=UPI0006C2A664|nr:hypothetical protein [Sphingopyxis sp. C-1]GAO78952.1 hypothetical protein SC1_02265 [Sphingopyxis sp. C-1]